jgi:hypothetical protein
MAIMVILIIFWVALVTNVCAFGYENRPSTIAVSTPKVAEATQEAEGDHPNPEATPEPKP